MKPYFKTIIVVASLWAALVSTASAATINWTNLAGGYWSLAANWNPNQVPGGSDTAVITNAGVTVSLNAPTAVGAIILGTNGPGTVTLKLASQTLSLNGPLTVNPSGSFTVDSGTLFGNTNAAILHGTNGWTGGTLGGVLTLASNSTLYFTAGTNHYIGGCLFTNFGTVNWIGCTLNAGGGSVFYNYGLWNAQDDQQLNNYYGGTGAMFINYGAFRKSGGASEFATATAFDSGVVFNQVAGVLDVQNGTNGLEVEFQGGGNFTGGYITTNQFGLTVLNSGNFTINGTVTGTNTWADTGTFVGTNVISGALTWLGGTWNNILVTLTSNSVLNINSTPSHFLGGCLFTNLGTVNWIGCTLYAGNGSVFYNYGLWNAQDDQQLQDYYGGAGAVFNNFGTFRKSGGGPEFTNYTLFASGVVFNQLAGELDVQNGTNGLEVEFQGGANLTGGYITTNQFGLAVLNNGNFTLNGTVTGTNTWADTGTLVGTNVISGALTWMGGIWNNTVVTVSSNSVLNINSTPNHLMGGCLLTNFGTVNWIGCPLYSGDGAVFDNHGLWNAQDDQELEYYYGGAGATFNNYGTFIKTAGANNGAGTQIQSGVNFNNSGRLDCQVGVVSLQGGYSLTNGTLNFGISGRTNYGEISLTGAASLAGTVSANLNNGYIPINGNSFTNLHYGSFTGGFTTTAPPFADAWTTNYFATYFVLTVLNARPVFAALATNKFFVNELTTLNVTNSASDLNNPAETLLYSLAAGTNGMTVNSATGVFAWTPQQTNSPSTNVVSLAVANNGTPPLSATNSFTVVVIEVNQPPTLGTIGTQNLTVLHPFFLTNSAAEPNIHSTTAGYLLVSPPAGASISAGGLIAWTPGTSQTLTTNTIATIVTNSNPYDLVHPHLSVTNSFQAIVLPNAARTNITAFATNATFKLSWPADHTGWRIESQTNSLDNGLGTNWVAIPASAATNLLVLPVVSTNGGVFFRMAYP